MDSQERGDASAFTSPVPRARSGSQHLPPQKRARTTPKKPRPATRKPNSTPRKPRSSPKPTTPSITSVPCADTPGYGFRSPKQALDTSKIRVCPVGRVFPAPVSTQRVKAYWQFIVCVAADEYADVSRGDLKRDHAKSFYCLSCDQELPIEKGKSIVGPHMKKHHGVELRSFEEKECRRKELEDSRNLKDMFVPAGASEQSTFNAILAEWVGTSVRPISIVGDVGFVKAIRFANNAKTQLTVPSRQTVTEGAHTKASGYRLSLRIRLEDDDECCFYSLSSDIWTSLKSESFISLTLHYVDAGFDMHSWTLEVTEIPGNTMATR